MANDRCRRIGIGAGKIPDKADDRSNANHQMGAGGVDISPARPLGQPQRYSPHHEDECQENEARHAQQNCIEASPRDVVYDGRQK